MIKLQASQLPRSALVDSHSQCRASFRGRVIVRASNEGDSPISEDLIQRLKSAEEEAQRLRQELAAAKAVSSGSESDEAPAAPAVKPPRIDGADLRRETLSFVESKPRNWLSESDVDFFTGAGPSEADGSSGTAGAEEAAIVQRRLLIGLGLTVGLGAFALVPTEQLAPKPSKPLFFYLTPLIRVQGILDEIERVIPDGDYQKLKTLLSRIEGPPNNVQENLRFAASSLPNSRDAQEADTLARDVYEYLKGIDYQTYYESMPGGAKDQQALFDYSLKSTRAAQIKIKEFLKLMPTDDVEAAESQVNFAY